ncbi:uncharacterized protein LOC119249623 isoform X2 [Talpa occidentalis]|uniref:uncharacterized protein LOC119249623 isoform X2 n=1 Tax=Talpa occidentalis TaxID=50954 RepID=UPI00188DD2A3|nr:uncharacterized protein LOC119249623 isoform X2 [Talpa occidentalis]
MSQTPQPSHEHAQPGFLPAAPKNTQDQVQDPLSVTNRTQDPPPINYSSQVNFQDPPPANEHQISAQDAPPSSRSHRVSFQGPLHTNNHRVSTQDTQPSFHSRRVSFQDPLHANNHGVSTQDTPPGSHSHRVSFQGPLRGNDRRVSTQDILPGSHSRRVSFQSSLATIHGHQFGTPGPPPATDRRLSAQDTQPSTQSRRVSFQTYQPITHSHRVSIPGPLLVNSHQVSAEDTRSVTQSPRGSIQGSASITQSPWVSIQGPSPASSYHISIQNTPPTKGRKFSSEDMLSPIQSCQVSFQDISSVIDGLQSSSQKVSPIFQARLLSLTDTESTAHSSEVSTKGQQPTPRGSHSSLPHTVSPLQSTARVSALLTLRPSTKSDETLISTSQKVSKASVGISQLDQSDPDSTHSLPPVISREGAPFRSWYESRRHSQLSIGWRLLHEAKKISHKISLALGLAGIVVIGLICLGQPWLHFQVPLRPPGHAAGPLTFHITTMFYVRCPDVSCMHEFDKNAYLLDFAWAFFLIASISSLCLCSLLLHIMFFTSSNLPVLDFSNTIFSFLAGTSMMLGILFYLMQAQQFLQEGMTYKLGNSFYLTWIGIFFFLMTGILSYLNYTNFWSVLALPGLVWT